MENARRQLMDEAAMLRCTKRLALEALEGCEDPDKLLFVGILRRGASLAKEMASVLQNAKGIRVPVGTLDITLYRDDMRGLSAKPVVRGNALPVPIEDREVVMVDDVLFTGRTARAGLDALMDLGRPRSVKLCVLIDRGHRQLPIKADHVGKSIPTSMEEVVRVRVKEYDSENGVYIEPLQP